MIKPVHIVLLVIVILLLFGAKKLPEVAGSVGKSMKVFKKEVKELREDDVPEQHAQAAQYPQAGQLQPGVGQQPTYQPQQYGAHPYTQQPLAEPAQPTALQGYAQPGQQPYPQQPYPPQGGVPGDVPRS